MKTHSRLKRAPRAAVKCAAAFLAFALFAFGHGPAMDGLRACPDAVYASSQKELSEKLGSSAAGFSSEAASSFDETLSLGSAPYRLFGLITVKRVRTVVAQRASLIPGGEAVGVAIRSKGVLIVGLDSSGGASPAARAGLRAGDVIVSVNGREISSAEELSDSLRSSSGQAEVTALRAGKSLSFTVRSDPSSGAQLGAWVRDSTVGVGTLSFWVPDSSVCAALGHAVTDADTGVEIPVETGSLVYAQVIGVTRGRQGAPGEISGTFGAESPRIGSIYANMELGVFASLTASLPERQAIPVAFPDEVKAGEATLISSASGELIGYSCRIIRASRQAEPAPKGLIIEVTDERLKELTGGIVQGMSGCPIIQGGRLAGVVTHVFVNDPKRGYGAYAYWILESAEGS